MAPVVQIQTNNKPPPEKIKKPAERRAELFCRVKYSNTLPDIPFDPKFVVYPFENNRFVQYKQTSLEKNYKHDLLTEQDLGVSIDLINPETYELPENVQPYMRLPDEDERLLEDEIAAPQDTKRSRCHNRAISWLKKTEYISTEFNRYGASSDKTETKVGFGVKKKMQDEDLCLDKESQILAINKTFEAAKKPITSHPGKPGVKPVEVQPLFPDLKMWKYPFAQVMFDAEPAPPEKEKEMSRAFIRGFVEPDGTQYVGYFMANENTMNKRKLDELEDRDYIDNEEYEYDCMREYNWTVKNKNATKGFEEDYFFVWRDNEVCYNELETRLKLTKRRVKQEVPTKKVLVIKHRPLNEAELQMYENRMKNLEPKQDDEDEDVEDEEEEMNTTPKIDGKDEEDNKIDEKESNSSEESEKSGASDSESEPEPTPKKPPPKRAKVSNDSDKSSSSSSSSGSESEDEKSSSNSSDSDNARDKVRKQTAAEIFGSDSD